MRKIYRILGMVLFLAVGVLPNVASASREGGILARGGFGLALNPPVRVDAQLEGEYFWKEFLSVGLDMDFLFRGPTNFVFTPFARYYFDLDKHPLLLPYVGGGVGVSVNTNGNGALDLMVPNVGFKYTLIEDRLYVGSDASTHLVTNFNNTSWDFRILLGTLSYRF